MAEEINEVVEEKVEETPEETPEEETITIPKKEYDGINQTVGSLKRQVKDYKKSIESQEKPGELDETSLDYLDLKGITDEDEVKVVQEVVAKTGKTARQALKDEYVQSKLASIKAEKAVKNATPSSTKRGGNQSNDLSSAMEKFERTGELPEDFEMKSKVINAFVDKANTNKPAWH